MINIQQTKNTEIEAKKPLLTPQIEERMRVIANIIIDRIIEGQISGKLPVMAKKK